METVRKTLIIGSRESLLAVRQSEIVMEYMEKTCPGIRCELVTMKTTGDRIMERLDRIGGKGLFVKELDQALRDGKIDLSVQPDPLPLLESSGYDLRRVSGGKIGRKAGQ